MTHRPIVDAIHKVRNFPYIKNGFYFSTKSLQAVKEIMSCGCGATNKENK